MLPGKIERKGWGEAGGTLIVKFIQVKSSAMSERCPPPTVRTFLMI
jgi:hypothetical protein